MRYVSFFFVVVVLFQAMELVPQRDRALQGELHKQNSNDELRKKFADKANEVGAYSKAKMEVTDQLVSGLLQFNFNLFTFKSQGSPCQLLQAHYL